MNFESIDDLFSEFSEGMLALMSGIAIIITITFFIYEIGPLFSEERTIFMFSIFALIVCIVSSISFYLAEITLLPDVIGKLLTGLTITIFAVILFHVGRSYGISSLPEIVFIGFLGFVSALTLTRGVLVPLFGEEMFLEMSETDEDEFSDIDEIEDVGEDEKGMEPAFSEDTEEDEDLEMKGSKNEDDPSQENEPW